MVLQVLVVYLAALDRRANVVKEVYVDLLVILDLQVKEVYQVREVFLDPMARLVLKVNLVKEVVLDFLDQKEVLVILADRDHKGYKVLEDR